MADSHQPQKPVPVLVRDADVPTRWALGVLKEWRWIDETIGTWEGFVSIEARRHEWVPGERMKRIGHPET